jgi:TRAP-type C4-dicarboxylate transport system permease small subunit
MILMRTLLLATALTLSLAACSTSQPVSNDVAAAEIALTSAERVALIYTTLPRCGGAVTICSAQATVDKIKALDTEAYTAVKAAQKNSALISAAWAAISSFQSAIPTK